MDGFWIERLHPDDRKGERIAALQEQLAAALGGLDVDAVDRAIDEVRMVDPEAAEALALLASGFDYGRMLALLPVHRETAE